MANILVLGAYGLIGAACVRALQQGGHTVVGLGRSRAAAQRFDPQLDWRIADIALLTVEAWREALAGIDVVVNAAGALQDGPRDSLAAIHETALERLCRAAAGTPVRIVQISAAGVATDASTAFFRSKARGDALLQASDLEWVILRPTLVIGPNAYGGTALLRGVAGLPWVTPKVFDTVPIQTIGLDDLAAAVSACASAKVPLRRVYDLTEPTGRSFGETVALMRAWLGLPPAIARIPVPGFVLAAVGRGADALGWLGWRSPMRTTSLRVLSTGIIGDPAAWRSATGRDIASLPETLRRIPSTLQERWFARLYMLLPLAIGGLAAFWIASGLIGLLRVEEAVAVLDGSGLGDRARHLFVICGALADIALGAMVLYRPWARRATIGMCLLAAGYIAGAIILTPALFADPLGPMVKVFPAIILAILTNAMLDER